MRESVTMTIGDHHVVVATLGSNMSGKVVGVDVFGCCDEKLVAKIAMGIAEAKAFHAALGAVVADADEELQIGLERAKADWRCEQ